MLLCGEETFFQGLGNVYTELYEFSTGSKFVHLGVPLTRNHANRTEL